MSVSPELHVPIIRLTTAPNKNYLRSSDNPRKLCLVYSSAFSTEECYSFLNKVFKAVEIDFNKEVSKLELEDESGISISQHPCYQEHELLISFGPSLQNLGLKVASKKYHPFEFNNKKLLWVNNPKVILDNPSLKKQLWLNLQEMFLLK